jgi:hypothetical protein
MTAIDNAIRETAVQQQTQDNGVLPSRPLNHAEHYAYYGALPSPDRLPLGELAALMGHAGVRGRGGAGFPLYRKIVSVSGAARARKIMPTIIANGCEGEPASHKDKHLLWLASQLAWPASCGPRGQSSRSRRALRTAGATSCDGCARPSRSATCARTA